MELALYCPVCGYYEKEKDIGKSGDFFTSVSVGSLFGELLALQFSEWREQLRIADCGLRIVEGGAHEGKLAKDILTWMRERRPEMFSTLEYCIVEPSERRRERQQESLSSFEKKIRWASELSTLSPRHSIIFANELLDAMPVRRFGWDAKQHSWFEWGVVVENDKFRWTRMPAEQAAPALPGELLAVLPDGFVVESSPAAEEWWRGAAKMLTTGKLLTFDYGFTAEELLSPERTNGTVRAYSNHRSATDVLASVGEQDLTAHVNFTAIQLAGEAAGLKTELFSAQSQFLTRVAERAWRDGANFGEWTSARTRQFQTLTHPEHLGEKFRVLVQSR